MRRQPKIRKQADEMIFMDLDVVDMVQMLEKEKSVERQVYAGRRAHIPPLYLKFTAREFHMMNA